MAIALSTSYLEDTDSDVLAGQGSKAATLTARYLQRPPTSLAAPAAAPASAGSIKANEIGESERLATADDEAHAFGAGAAGFDVRLVRESFTNVAASSAEVMEYFYSHLFVRHPDMRPMFPHTMRAHMDQVFASIERVVSIIDNPGQLTAYLGQVGRDHRKYGARERHYEPALAVLLDTFRHFCGHYWTEATQAAWEGALGHAASIIIAAARRDAAQQPAWWVAEVTAHERRRPDLAVLTLRPDQPLRYTAGQYLSVQVPRWPRVWRDYSIANAPRENGLVDLHVRAVPGGLVSGTLVHRTAPGDTVLLGQARGTMTAGPAPDRDLLCIAGGTGLAPVKAIIEDVIGTAAAAGQPRRIGLLFGARTEEDLYDLAALRELESGYPALTVTPVVSEQPEFTGVRGMLAETAARYASCEGKDIFVSGPAAMIRATVSALAGQAEPDQIRRDPLPDRMTG